MAKVKGITLDQKKLAESLVQYGKKEGCSLQSALRDLLTDLRHIADFHDLDIDLAYDGSEEVYDEEKEA